MISVLLPVRDGAAHLGACIESLEAQTEDDFEVLAVDDGSQDATPRILAEWAARDARVTVLSQPPGGVVRALERARADATRPFLARMDADDIASPVRFERQLAWMRRAPSLSGCGCSVEYFPRDIVRDGAARYEEWLNAITTPDDVAREIFVECPLAHPAFFLRSEWVERVGGYIDRGWPEDYDLVLRMWSEGALLGNVPEVLLRWREGPQRLSRTAQEYSAEAFRRCKVHYLLRTRARDRDGLVVWGAGPIGKAFAREVLAQGGRVSAFVDVDPRKVGQNIHGATVLPPSGVNSVRGSYCVAAVGQAGVRDEIRVALGEAGWIEGPDFIAVA